MSVIVQGNLIKVDNGVKEYTVLMPENNQKSNKYDDIETCICPWCKKEIVTEGLRTNVFFCPFCHEEIKLID